MPAARRGGRFEGLFSVADWYATFCELAGAEAYDHEANATNAWLKEQGLPLLPPVDGVRLWAALANGSAADPGPRADVHLSAKAIIVRRGARLLKLVSGGQNPSKQNQDSHFVLRCDAETIVWGVLDGHGADNGLLASSAASVLWCRRK